MIKNNKLILMVFLVVGLLSGYKLSAQTISSTLNNKAGVVEDRWVEFTATVTEGNDSGVTVNERLILDDPTQASNIAVEYKDGSGNWQALSFSTGGIIWFGPASGFPLQDATTTFRVKFKDADTIAYKLEIIETATSSAIASASEKVIAHAYKASTIASTLNAKKGVIATKRVEYSVTNTAGSDSNTMVKGYMTLKDKSQASHINTEYTDGTSWYSLSFSNGVIVFGPSTGFPLKTATSYFRTTFDTAGTFAYKLNIISTAGDTLATANESVTVNAYVAPELTSTLNGKTGVIEDRWIEFTAKATEGSDSGRIINQRLLLDDATQASNITAQYKDGSGNWQPLSFSTGGMIWFGPASGFPLADATTTFRVKFNNADTIAYKLQVIDASTSSVISSTKEEVIVNAYVAPTITSTLDGKTGVVANRSVEYSVTTTTGSDSNTMVLGYMTLSDKTQAKHIRSEYKDGSTWYPLTFTNGVIAFGPSTGFPLKNTSSFFRTIFDTAGTYAYTLDVVTVGGDTLASTKEEVTVKYQAPTIASTLDGKTSVIEDKWVEFTASVTEGSDSGRVVNERLILDDATQAADIKVEYKDGSGNWQPLSFATGGMIWFGPASGFPLTDATTTFRVKFDNADTIAYRLQIIDASTSAVVSTSSEEVVVNAYVAPAISSTLDGKTGVIEDRWVEYAVTTKEGSDSNTMVRGRMVLADATQAADITAEYKDASGNWQALSISTGGVIWFGPSTGFPLDNATSYFRAKFANADTVGYKLEIVEVATSNVLASANEEVIINAYIAPTIASTLDGKTGVIATKETSFSVTTTAGSDTNKTVQVYITLADTTQASDISVSYYNGASWMVLPFSNGMIAFGPAAGFSLADATTDLKVTFADGGKYAYSLAIIELATKDTLAYSEEEITVADYIAPAISSTLNNKTGVIATKEFDFDVTIVANTDENRMVKARLVLDDTTQASDISASYYDGTNWLPLTFANGILEFGPATGFPLANATTNFKVTFANDDTYHYNLEILDASTNDVLVSADESVTVAAYSAPTIASTLNNMSGVIATKEASFSVTTTAGNEANETVNAYITLADSTQAAGITVSYFDGTSYQTLNFSNGIIAFGPAAGFPLSDATSDFKVIFADGGTYAYTLDVVSVATGDTLATSAESVTVADFVEPVISSTLNNMSGVVATKAVDFDVTVKVGTDENRMVTARLVLDSAAQASDITASYFDGTTYQPLTFVNGVAAFGPATGFPMMDATSSFRVIFANAGTYAYNLEILDAATNSVLVSADESVTVNAYVNATIASTLNNMSGVVATKEVSFAVTTTAGSEANETVNAYITLADPAQASGISVSYTDGTNWFPLTFTNGIAAFGPATGFPLMDATSDFKVTFANAGTYAYQLAIVTKNGDTLAAANESVTVAAFVNPTIASTLNNKPNVIVGNQVDFDVTTTAGTDENRLVKARLVLDSAAQASNITASYFDGSTYQPLTFVNGVVEFGPATGFPLTNATSKFRITFAAAGTYAYTLEILDATTNDVLATADEQVEVKATVVMPTIASTLNNKTGVIANKQTTFTLTPSTGTETGRMVRIRWAFDNAAQGDDVSAEYMDASGNWQIVSFVNGAAQIGGATGFALSNDPISFRVTFSKDGIYNYNFEIRDAANNALLASADESVTVGVNGINENAAFASAINVYPNPAVSNLTIELPKTGLSQVMIFSATGQAIQQLNNVNGKVSVDVSALAKGIYFVKVVNGNQVATKRIEILK